MERYQWSGAIEHMAELADETLVYDNVALVEDAFRVHQPSLLAFLSRRLNGDQSAAADVAQETYTRIIASRRRFGAGDTRSLLFRIARNLLVDRHRREVTRQRIEEAIAVRDASVGPPVPDQILSGQEELARMHKAILNLPPRCQEIYVLHRFEEMSYGMIAARCGISISMVEKHIQKALQRLAEAANSRPEGGQE